MEIAGQGKQREEAQARFRADAREAAECFSNTAREALVSLSEALELRLAQTESRIDELHHEFAMWRAEVERVEKEVLANEFQEAIEAEEM